MSIIIGADVVPTKTNEDLFINADNELIGEDIAKILTEADYRIFNLEVPLTDVNSPIKKSGPHLSAPTAAVAGYKMLKADLVTLSNNHVLDQDEQGLLSTMETLDAAGISRVGAGKTPIDAKKPFVFSLKGKKYGVYACCENEFSVVTEKTAGSNPYDPLYSFDDVADLKKDCDYVIVLYHGGKEYYPYPSPMLQKRCRRFIEKGADLVLCQHSHTVGCKEEYIGKTIVYGQGNFIFDHSDRKEWQTGLLVRVSDELKIDFIPVKKIGEKVRLADEEQKKSILDGFYSRSEEIKSPEFIIKAYADFAEKMKEYYIETVSGKRSFWDKVFNRLTFGAYAKRKAAARYGEDTLLALKNAIVCEAHGELFVQGLKGEIYKD